MQALCGKFIYFKLLFSVENLLRLHGVLRTLLCGLSKESRQFFFSRCLLTKKLSRLLRFGRFENYFFPAGLWSKLTQSKVLALAHMAFIICGAQRWPCGSYLSCPPCPPCLAPQPLTAGRAGKYTSRKKIHACRGLLLVFPFFFQR